MRTLKVHSLSSLASLIALIILLFAFNAFCDGDPPEEEDPLPFSTNVIIFSSCNLTNRFAGKLETTNPGISGNWIHIIPQGGTNNFITVCALSTNRYHDVRNKVTCEFQMGNTNENCHVSVNETLVCLWDETADEKGQDEDLVTFCKKLSFDEEVSGTILPASNGTDHDSDVYYFESNGKSGFCFEVDSSDDLDYEISYNSGSWRSINKVQLLSAMGYNILYRYRLYVTNEIKNVQHSFLRVKRNNSSTDFEITYNITLKKARPLLLVHGIESRPIEEKDNYLVDDEKKDKIAFYYIYKDVSAWYDFAPCIPFPFPWNHGKGLYDFYCLDSNSQSLSKFYLNKAGTWYLEAAIMAHSLGGILAVKQIENDASFANSVHGLVCLGSPFCGSIIGNYATLYAAIFGGVHETSTDNITHLARGSSHVLNRMRDFPDVIRNLHYKRFIYSDIKEGIFSRFLDRTGKGDGVVSYCSSNVGDTLHWYECKGEETELDHIKLDDLKLKEGNGKFKIIYDTLKNLIKQ